MLSHRIANPVSIHTIASQTQIEHHATVQDYLQTLQDMDVLFIQPALREDKLAPALKKDKKIHFTDPFIAQSLIAWAKNIEDPWEYAKAMIVNGDTFKEHVVEGCISSFARRNIQVCYIKSEGEVDLAIISGKRFLPVEVKWTKHLRRGDLKQILKYKNGIIGYKGDGIGNYEHLIVLPIPLIALML